MFFVVGKREWRIVALVSLCLLLLPLLARKKAVPVTGEADIPRILVIDPGHGGEDGGAVSSEGTVESEINLAIAHRLEQLCFLAGEKTVMTRTEDISLHNGEESIRARKASDIRKRAEIVNALQEQTLISIHQNSLPQVKSVHGAQVFYNDRDDSKALAAQIQTHLNRSINLERGKESRPIDPSVYLMKHAACPSVLVECGFLSNERETALLKTDEHQKVIALTVAAGCLSWIGEQE